MSKKRTYQEVKEFVGNLGYELITKEYKDTKQKLTLKDKNEYYYFVSFNNLKSGQNSHFVGKANPYTIQNIKLWCKLNNKPFELISNTYINNSKKLKWKCLKEDCGEEFEASWNSILQGSGCSYCHGQKVGTSNCLATKRPNLIKEWHPTLNEDLTPWDFTCNSHEYVWWKCSNNPKHEWRTAICNRTNNNSGCPYCASNPIPSEDYNLLVSNPKLCEEWDYEKNDKKPEEYCPNSDQYVYWICKECGHKWKAKISNRNHGNECPQCVESRNESKGENKISEFCKLFNISYDSQYTFDDLRGIGNRMLKIDSTIFWDKERTMLKILIEYDGIHHFRPVCFGGISMERAIENFKKQIENDIKKNLYCVENNIQLIRIPYWEYDNIEKYLKYYLIENSDFDY